MSPLRKKQSWDRPIDSTRAREQYAAAGPRRAGHRVASFYWIALHFARRLRLTTNKMYVRFSPPAPREAQNTDLSRMPARFDTTENALVTSRALCWLVAFAAGFSKNLSWPIIPATELNVCFNTKCRIGISVGLYKPIYPGMSPI